MQSVRPDAPWCPSNIEFIRRINGLDSIDEVQRIVFDASYLVLGLGDVYLGAPVATPLDPRHRLVTTKYNPARTWTAENSVGIGGAYLCVYGMEGPGGYQFVGRTVQMWNTWRTTREFAPARRGCCASSTRSASIRWKRTNCSGCATTFSHGKYHPEITAEQFRLRDYHAFLDGIRGEAEIAKARQQAAFEAERERWKEIGLDRETEAQSDQLTPPERTLPRGCRAISSPAHGSVWNVAVKAGDRVRQGQRLLILESMKMEIAVSAPAARHRGRSALRARRPGRGRAESNVSAAGGSMNFDLNSLRAAYRDGSLTPGRRDKRGLPAHSRIAASGRSGFISSRKRNPSRRAEALGPFATNVAALRHPVRDQRQHRSRRRSHHRRLSRVCLYARAIRRRGRASDGRGRNPDR